MAAPDATDVKAAPTSVTDGKQIRRRQAKLFRRTDVRLMIGVLAVALPMMTVLAALASTSSTSLTISAEDKATSMARSVAARSRGLGVGAPRRPLDHR